MLGHKTYQRLEDIGKDVDLAVIAIPARMVPQTLRDCIEKGVKSAVIISAGFKEAGTAGIVLEEELRTEETVEKEFDFKRLMKEMKIRS